MLIHPIVRARLALLAASLSVTLLLAGCETIVDVNEEGAKATAQAAAYQTTDRTEQLRRFGAYARVAESYWTGRWFKGEVYAVEYRWVVPGVALEEVQHQGVHQGKSRFYWDPQSNTLTRIDWQTARVLKDIRVQPGGQVAWPSQMGGVIDAFYVDFANGAVSYRYGDETATLSRATREQFVANTEAANAQLAQQKRDEREESNARWDAVLGGVSAATSAVAGSYSQQLQPQRAVPQQQRPQQQAQRQPQMQVQSQASAKPAAAAPAAAARPAAAAVPAPAATVAKASPSSCVVQDVTHPIMSRDMSEEAVRADIAQRAGKMCGGTGRLGEAKCSSSRDISIDAKGKQHDLGTRTHVCTAVLTCGQREVCRGGPAGASAQ